MPDLNHIFKPIFQNLETKTGLKLDWAQWVKNNTTIYPNDDLPKKWLVGFSGSDEVSQVFGRDSIALEALQKAALVSWYLNQPEEYDPPQLHTDQQNLKQRVEEYLFDLVAPWHEKRLEASKIASERGKKGGGSNRLNQSEIENIRNDYRREQNSGTSQKDIASKLAKRHGVTAKTIRHYTKKLRQ
jgi:hypothetical protein